MLCVRAARSKYQQLEKRLWVPGPRDLAVINWKDLVYEKPTCQQLEKPECVNNTTMNLILYPYMLIFATKL